jgi:hypothetical protein
MHILILFSGKSKGLTNDAIILNDYIHLLSHHANSKFTLELLPVDLIPSDYRYNPEDESFFYPEKNIKPDLVIHIQNIYKNNNSSFEKAINILVPNPEWTNRLTATRARDVDQIWHKTKYSKMVFSEILKDLTHLEHFYLGFSTIDKNKRVKNFNSFSHFRGSGTTRSTDKIVSLWMRRTDFPLLRLKFQSSDPNIHFLQLLKWFRGKNIEIKYGFVSDEEYFEDLTESGGIQLCTSEMEGFGHYINEARMIGSVPVITNGPPMNELVDNNSGFLIEPSHIARRSLGWRHIITEENLEKTIEKIIKEPITSLIKKGANARIRYEIELDDFVKNLNLILELNRQKVYSRKIDFA